MATGGYLDIEGPQEYMKDGGDAATLEVEGGEVIMPMGGSIADTTLYGGAKATNVSPVAYKVEGASHQQTNAAGTKGVPVKADSELYVFTDRLDEDGRENPSKSIAKTANKINKSIVDMMKNPLDRYGNNDVAMQDMQQELLILQKKNDQAKFLKEARKILTSKDEGIFDKFIDHVVKNKPEEMGTGNMGDTSSTLDPAMMVEGQVEGQNPMAPMNQQMAHGGKYEAWKKFQEGGQYMDESLMTPQERFRKGLYKYQDGKLYSPEDAEYDKAVQNFEFQSGMPMYKGNKPKEEAGYIEGTDIPEMFGTNYAQFKKMYPRTEENAQQHTQDFFAFDSDLQDAKVLEGLGPDLWYENTDSQMRKQLTKDKYMPLVERSRNERLDSYNEAPWFFENTTGKKFKQDAKDRQFLRNNLKMNLMSAEQNNFQNDINHPFWRKQYGLDREPAAYGKRVLKPKRGYM